MSLAFWPGPDRWAGVYGPATVCSMDVTDRFVLVPATQLDDLLENVRMAADSIADPRVADALRAQAAEVRAHSLMEP